MTTFTNTTIAPRFTDTEAAALKRAADAPRQRRADIVAKDQERIAKLRADGSVTLKQIRDEERLGHERARAREQAKLDAVIDEQNKLLRELRKEERRALLEREDENLFIDPDAPTVFFKLEDVNAYNGKQAEIFVAENPDYYRDPLSQNFQIMLDYMKINGVGTITSAKMWKAAYEKLRAVGALIERPQPTPVAEAEPVEENDHTPDNGIVSVFVYPAQTQVDPDYEDGFDLETGEPTRLTRFQIERLSSREYQQFKRLGRKSSAGLRNID